MAKGRSSQIHAGMLAPVVLAVQFANSKYDGDDDEGDNGEAPGGRKHEDQHHARLSHTPQRNIQVQTHLVGHCRGVGCKPAVQQLHVNSLLL